MPEDDEERKETGRIEAFSDGVFAIAITLLILTIPVPPIGTAIRQYVLTQWPFFLAYVVSFLSILVMWANHHDLFTLIVRTDRRFLILNGILLMLITFLNYPTAVFAAALRANQSERFAAVFYVATLMLVTIVYDLVWIYASYKQRLLDKHCDPHVIERISREYRFGPLYYLIAFALAFWQPFVALGVTFALAVYFSIAARATSPHSSF